MLTKYQTPQLSKVIECIKEFINPEKIFLLGVTVTYNTSENIFRGSVLPSFEAKEYQLFILLPHQEKRRIEELQEIVETKCKEHALVTTLIAGMNVFNHWLVKGHLFAHIVHASNCLVYDAGNTALAEPGVYSIPDLYQRGQKEFKDWFAKAVEFMIGVEVYRVRKQYPVAVFMLHQATELAFMASLRLTTGFRVATHNLDKMLRYAVPFCGDEFNIFPRNNDKERRLFKLLQKAYIYGRYKDDFVVEEKDLLLIKERVEQLLSAAQQISIQNTPKTTYNETDSTSH